MTTPANPRKRIIDHGEVFTPPGLVNDMLDLVAYQCERIEPRFLEPACGNGNFLAEVLRRKLLTVDKTWTRNRDKWQRDAILAVCSLYGIDLLPDNVAACRERLLKVIADAFVTRFNELLPEEVQQAARYILSKNIVQGNALSFRTPDHKWIVFPEWSPLNGSMLKRRDYTYEGLIACGEKPRQLSLLSEQTVEQLSLFSDVGEKVFIPTPVRDFPPCHYLRVQYSEDQVERT